MQDIDVVAIITALGASLASFIGLVTMRRNERITNLERAVKALQDDVQYERSDKAKLRKEFEQRIADMCADHEREITELRHSYETRIDDLESQVQVLQQQNVKLGDSLAAYQNAQRAARGKG